MTAKISVVGYRHEHLEKIQIKACHAGETPKAIEGKAVTLLLGEEVLAIIGWFFVASGVVQVWSFLSDAISKAKIAFHKEVLSMLRFAFESNPVRRVQMTVLVGFDAGRDWAHSLGFECEGVMKSFGPNGEDHWLFARLL